MHPLPRHYTTLPADIELGQDKYSKYGQIWFME
jgi:hypothetical protein